MKNITLILALATVAAFAQGPLIPLGPPEATGKSLTEIHAIASAAEAKAEKRIPVNATTAPAGTVGGESYQHVIPQSGSYYLTADVNVSGGSGIYASSPGITLDLNGFRVVQSGTGGSGVGISFESVTGAISRAPTTVLFSFPSALGLSLTTFASAAQRTSPVFVPLLINESRITPGRVRKPHL